uniref:Secreted protein n=1 Tax=Syphacia muris TaxID=451379 RepID=A0A0N5AHR2_9BILA
MKCGQRGKKQRCYIALLFCCFIVMEHTAPNQQLQSAHYATSSSTAILTDLRGPSVKNCSVSVKPGRVTYVCDPDHILKLYEEFRIHFMLEQKVEECVSDRLDSSRAISLLFHMIVKL